MNKIIMTILVIASLSGISSAKSTVTESQTDYNNEVSAMVDAQNQQNYQQQMEALKNNQTQSADYSNCPNCNH